MIEDHLVVAVELEHRSPQHALGVHSEKRQRAPFGQGDDPCAVDREQDDRRVIDDIEQALVRRGSLLLGLRPRWFPECPNLDDMRDGSPLARLERDGVRGYAGMQVRAVGERDNDVLLDDLVSCDGTHEQAILPMVGAVFAFSMRQMRVCAAVRPPRSIIWR